MNDNTTSSVKARLRAAMTAAMKARDEVALAALRQALSEVAVVETADAFVTAGRPEQADHARAHAAVLEAYLPAALGDDDLQRIIGEEIASAAAAGVEGMKAMGKVVSAVRAKAGPTADGAKIAALVKAALA